MNPDTEEVESPRDTTDGFAASPQRGLDPLGRLPALIILVAALVGASFASTSTSDFVQHLDRNVHDITCSYNPGDEAKAKDSPCHVTMYSPYSSYFRKDYWGGIPVSLWAIAVFAFMAYRGGFQLYRGRPLRSEALFLFLASLLPAGMSIGYYNLSKGALGMTELCKVCGGIYGASVGLVVGGILALVLSRGTDGKGIPRFGIGFIEGCAFVGALTLAYVTFAPQASATERGVKGCGTLVQPGDEDGIMIPTLQNAGGTPTIELLDPLCPTCKAFDARLKQTEFGKKLDIKSVLFPLDSTCNWMLSTPMHPGACAVSEAMMCAAGVVDGKGNPAEAQKILAAAFEHQEEWTAAAKADEPGFRTKLEGLFPVVKGCLGSPQVKNKMVKTLRWSVANALPMRTPQIFVNGASLCEEDLDLGMEYTLNRMTANAAGARK
jgi:hypothetical protein